MILKNFNLDMMKFENGYTESDVSAEVGLMMTQHYQWQDFLKDGLNDDEERVICIRVKNSTPADLKLVEAGIDHFLQTGLYKNDNAPDQVNIKAVSLP